jgi:hypothetical protein
MDESVPLVLTGVRVTNLLLYKFITGRKIRTCCRTSSIGYRMSRIRLQDEQERLQDGQDMLQDEQDEQDGLLDEQDRLQSAGRSI